MSPRTYKPDLEYPQPTQLGPTALGALVEESFFDQIISFLSSNFWPVCKVSKYELPLLNCFQAGPVDHSATLPTESLRGGTGKTGRTKRNKQTSCFQEQKHHIPISLYQNLEKGQYRDKIKFA